MHYTHPITHTHTPWPRPLKPQEYFDRAGERLRQDMLAKWGGRFTVQRRILAVDSTVEA